MTEKEKREDEALKNCIQKSYGLSDEQLLAELEELEDTLLDDEFEGAEERIFAKIQERKLEREREDDNLSSERVISSTSLGAKPMPIRKISKKKKWIVVGLAAALAVGAGVSTVGENNYFLQRDESKNSIVLDSGQNVVKAGDLQEAYEKIEEALGIPVLKVNNLPNTMKFEQLIMSSTRAILVFSNKNQKMYFMQQQESTEQSLGVNSDRVETSKKVHNSWLAIDSFVEENILENGDVEYSATIYKEKASYRLIGKMEEEIFCEILMELSY